MLKATPTSWPPWNPLGCYYGEFIQGPVKGVVKALKGFIAAFRISYQGSSGPYSSPWKTYTNALRKIMPNKTSSSSLLPSFSPGPDQFLLPSPSQKFHNVWPSGWRAHARVCIAMISRRRLLGSPRFLKAWRPLSYEAFQRPFEGLATCGCIQKDFKGLQGPWGISN